MAGRADACSGGSPSAATPLQAGASGETLAESVTGFSRPGIQAGCVTLGKSFSFYIPSGSPPGFSEWRAAGRNAMGSSGEPAYWERQFSAPESRTKKKSLAT